MRPKDSTRKYYPKKKCKKKKPEPEPDKNDYRNKFNPLKMIRKPK